MDPMLLREYQAKLADWVGQGYQILADNVDGELRVTAHYVSPGGRGSEREQEWWPLTPEIVRLLAEHGIKISTGLAGR